MEKRLTLSIFLSLLVIYIWSIFVQQSQINPKSHNGTQLHDNKEIMDIEKSVPPIASQGGLLGQPLPKTPMIEEKIKQIESKKLIADFSDAGGLLKKVFLKEYRTALPLDDFMAIPGYYDGIKYVLSQIDDRRIVYSYENDEYVVKKTYVLSDDDYDIHADIEITNKTKMSKLIDLNVQGLRLNMSNLNGEKHGNAQAMGGDKSLFEYVISSENDVHRKNNAFKFSSKEKRESAGNIRWVGFRDRYFCAISKPIFTTYGYNINPVSDHLLAINIESRGITIPPEGNIKFSSLIFVGPEKTHLLAKYGFGFEDIKRYYRIAFFDAVAKMIYSFMYMLNRFVPNWGACIIIMSLVVYSLTYPLTLRSMSSMKKMQAMQPKIAAVKDKHKNNPQKMNSEMMELYKKHKINPLGGCLPIVLQMPVFIGLYQVLWRSVSLKGASFLWIKDLSQPDRLLIFQNTIPLLDNELNLLPIIMIVVMFFQQKLTSANMVITDPAQATQQKMMGIMMPLFMGVIFYKFASGLTLYFVMFYLLSTLTQWKMSKGPKAA